ncbi:hypothetical protein, partial [Erwinia amylovora]|uniref:hypothetical protein n=1 Tax=Erwinia amylovora TaxID=552 RepID=UPI001C55797A
VPLCLYVKVNRLMISRLTQGGLDCLQVEHYWWYSITPRRALSGLYSPENEPDDAGRTTGIVTSKYDAPLKSALALTGQCAFRCGGPAASARGQTDVGLNFFNTMLRV